MKREAAPYLAEFLGTFGFVFVSASILVLGTSGTGPLDTLGVALARGIALLAFTYAFIHASGAHFNPAITISLWLTKQLETTAALGYLLVQLAGAVLAAIFIEGLFFPAKAAVPNTHSLDPLAAILIEALLTFFLVLVFYAVNIDRRSHTSHGGLSVGLLYSALFLVGFGFTGGVMNPALAFGPAFVSNFWSGQLIYWIGPILGAVVAALVYESGVLKK